MHQVDEKHIWHEYEDPQYTPADPKKRIIKQCTVPIIKTRQLDKFGCHLE